MIVNVMYKFLLLRLGVHHCACKVNLAMTEKSCCYVCKMPLNDTWPRIWENSFLKRLRPFFSSCFCIVAMVIVL